MTSGPEVASPSGSVGNAFKSFAEVTRMKQFQALFIRFTAVTAVVLSAAAARAAVWETRNQWSPHWEREYQDWVKTGWTRDFFRAAGPFQNMKVDCADAVYAMRFAFAYNNGLPFAINDPTGGRFRDAPGGGLISNEMTQFDHLPAERRARSLLNLVFGVGSTRSLVDDSYPVAISREAIHPGVFIRTDKANHHSWTVRTVSRTGIPHLLYATRPASPSLYERNEYPSVGFLFAGSNAPERAAGFRMFRNKEDLRKKAWDVPGYSLEQHQLPLSGWSTRVQSRLQLTAETPPERVERVLTDACRSARERVDFVNHGLRALAALGPRACMSAPVYDDHSTPSRDRRLRDSFIELGEAYRAAGEGSQLSDELRARVAQVLSGERGAGGPREEAYCPVAIGSGKSLTLGQVYARSMDNRLSNNPHDTLGMRWGEEAFPSARARGCPTY